MLLKLCAMQAFISFPCLLLGTNENEYLTCAA